MKSCRNTGPSRRPAAFHTPQTGGQSAPAARQDAAAPVNRYSHPIRVKSAARRGSSEELLAYIMESLSHQTELLEELLRRTEGGGPDTV